jgi:hypothetical protein
MVSKVELTITLLADWTAWACCFLSVLAGQQNRRRCSLAGVIDRLGDDPELFAKRRAAGGE